VRYGARRTLSQNGNSYTVVIPRLFLMQMCLYKGIPLDLEFDDQAGTITIRRGEPKPAGVNVRGNGRGARLLF